MSASPGSLSRAPDTGFTSPKAVGSVWNKILTLTTLAVCGWRWREGRKNLRKGCRFSTGETLFPSFLHPFPSVSVSSPWLEGRQFDSHWLSQVNRDFSASRNVLLAWVFVLREVWTPTHCIAEDGFELLTLLPSIFLVLGLVPPCSAGTRAQALGH